MFCKWCGSKITNNGVPCPSCGNKQAPLENGNGFWDLCTAETEDRPQPAESVNVPTQDAQPDFQAKKDIPEIEPHKKPDFKQKVLLLAAACLLLVALIEIAVGFGMARKYRAEMAALQESTSGTEATEDSQEIAEVHNTEAETVNTEPMETTGAANPEDPTEITISTETTAPEEPTEVTEPDAPVETTNPDDGVWEPHTCEGENNQNTEGQVSLEDLLENNEVFLEESYRLYIERHWIYSQYQVSVYMATGDLLMEENIRIYWQKKTADGERWETIAEGVPYIVVDSYEEATYRVICLMESEAGGKYQGFFARTY